MNAPQTVIFDFDGTIADSFALNLSIFRELSGWQGGQTPKEIARLRHLPVTKVLKELKLPLYQMPSLLMRGRKAAADRMHEVKVFSGMNGVIRELYRRKYQLFIMSTNSTQNVEQFLRDHQLRAYFEAIYGNTGVLNKAAALRRVVRHHQLSVESTWYIGDELRDIEATHKAHIRGIAVSWGYNDVELLADQHPTAIAQTPQDIVKIIVK